MGKKAVDALRSLLNGLYVEQARDWYPHRRGRKPSAHAQALWHQMIGTWPSVGLTDLKKWLPVSDTIHVDFSQQRKVLYLPPLDRDSRFVPVLSLEWHLDPTRDSITLRVMLVRTVKGHKKFHGIGFRLESGRGRHGFYHAQLVRSLGWGPAVECPSWLPERQPSFPLAARCPVTLMLALLLTMYGKDYCYKFITKHQLRHLKQYMKTLEPWIGW